MSKPQVFVTLNNPQMPRGTLTARIYYQPLLQPADLRTTYLVKMPDRSVVALRPADVTLVDPITVLGDLA